MLGSPSVTTMLSNAKPGDDASMNELLPLVYAELRALASSFLDRPGDAARTLQPTALVHEAFLKMVSADRRWSGREHFMAVAAKAMRQVLVDDARRKSAEKRGGRGGEGAARERISLDHLGGDEQSSPEFRVVELDDLLKELAKADERSARVAEMRLFGGMEQEQIARVLGVSRMTITTDWQFARAWLASRVNNTDRRVPDSETTP
jgi:RNA polymerase sigma-70 factor, ECF subfamily